MSTITTTVDLVRNTLQKYPLTRNSDDALYLHVCKKLLFDQGLDPYRITAAHFLQNRQKLGLPGYETVRRARQKLQSTDESLAPVPEVERQRMLNEMEMRNWARE